MSLTLVRSRSIRYRDGIFSRGRERRSRARSLLEQDLTSQRRRRCSSTGRKFPPLQLVEINTLIFITGRGEEVYLKVQVLFQKMFEKRG